MSPPKSLSPAARRLLDQYLESHSTGAFASEGTHIERRSLAHSLALQMRVWETTPIVLPRGVELHPVTDHEGDEVYEMQWPDIRLHPPLIAFPAPAMAAAVAWTVYMLHRPWAIDDEQLHRLVEEPPIPRARLVGLLLSVRFASWILEPLARMVSACRAHAKPDTEDKMEALFGSLALVGNIYGSRLTVALSDLASVLGVEEPDALVSHEVYRWRWMLHDYVRAFSPALHERLEMLGGGYMMAAEPHNAEQEPGLLWEDICDRRQLDTCMGLLLARAAMLDPRTEQERAADYVDPMATSALGSLAWWSFYAVQALDDEEHHIDERLRPEQIEPLVRMAKAGLEEIDPEMLAAVLDAFPVLRGTARAM